MKSFKIGNVLGHLYTITGPTGEIYQNVAISCAADPEGFTVVKCVVTRDSKGRVDVAWQHSDLTDGRENTASYDLEYDVRDGFWAVVQEHISMLNAGDFPVECIEYDF